MSYKRVTERDRNRYGEVKAHCETVQDVFDEDQRIAERLYELENKIENGTLVELPCKVGDTVYFCEHNIIRKATVTKVGIDYKGWFIKLSTNSFYETRVSAIGKRIFFTEQEAEAKLKELNFDGV